MAQSTYLRMSKDETIPLIGRPPAVSALHQDALDILSNALAGLVI